MRIDIGPTGGAMPIIVPNPQLGNPNAPVPNISDLKKLNAISAFINTAKKESVSSDTKNQAMADAFRIYMGIPNRERLGTSLTNNELTIIATMVTSIALLEENKKTVSSNTSSESSLKNLLISDIILIKNASFRYLAAMMAGENLKDSPVKKRANESGVAEYLYNKLTKKIVTKASEDLVNFVFPRNDFLAGFSLTFGEIRDLTNQYVEKYSMFTAESAVLIKLLRTDTLVRAVNFLSEDFSFTRESEILSRMNRKAIVMVPPYDLRKVAELISARKTGVYEGRWANLPNSLDPISGTSSLTHAFLRLKVLQTSMDVSFLLDDLFAKGEAFRTSLKEKPIGEEFSVGAWIIKNICDDETVDESLYENIFSSFDSEESILYLERYLVSQLGFLEDHRFTRVLRSILSIERNSDGHLALVRNKVEQVSTSKDLDGKNVESISIREEVVYPLDPSIGPDTAQRPFSDSARDICSELLIGKADTSVPDPTSASGIFRRKHFQDSLAKTKDVIPRRGEPGGSTALSAVSAKFLRDLYSKNKSIAIVLSEYLVGFSNNETQNYVVKVLHARENQLLGIDPMADLLSAGPDDNDDNVESDLFAGLDE